MTQTISYWLKSPATYIWMSFIVMACITTWAITRYYDKKIPVRDLDIAIVVKVLEKADDFCKKMNPRTFTVRASGLVIDAGCSKK